MTILCYHSVTRGWHNLVSIEAADFERQCALLARRGGVVPLAAVRDRLTAGLPLPAGTRVLTFDDGCADFATHAAPIMTRHGLPATMYVVAGSVTPAGVRVDWIRGQDPDRAPVLLTPDQIRELLSDLLGTPVTTLAYPFGRHSAHVRRAAQRAGYDCALALPEGPEPAGPFAIPRTGIYRGKPRWKFRLKTTTWYSKIRTSTAYAALRRTP